jgi:hypothetical protein
MVGIIIPFLRSHLPSSFNGIEVIGGIVPCYDPKLGQTEVIVGLL